MSEPEIVALAAHTYAVAEGRLIAAMERELAAVRARCAMVRRHAAAYVAGGPGLSGDELVASAAVMDEMRSAERAVDAARQDIQESHLQWTHAVSR